MYVTTKSGRKILLPNEAEETEIARHAIADGSHYSNAELNEFKPVTEFPALQSITKTVGRPKSESQKVPVSIRLSPEVVDFFKASGKGWQTRLDTILKDYVASNKGDVTL